MDRLNLKNILIEATSTGADYAELYFEDTTSNSVRVVMDKVDEITSNHQAGCALRLLKGVEEAYGYTNDISYDGILKLAKSLKSSFNSERVIDDFEFNDVVVNKHTEFNNLEIDKNKIVKVFIDANKVMKEYDKRIIQTISSFSSNVQKIRVVNTNGVDKEDVRFIQRGVVQSVAKDEKSMQVGHEQFGGNFDFDAIISYDFNELAKEAAKSAITMLEADEMVGGVYDVVIHNAFGGVIFHEACGHALEATSVAKNLSVFAGKIGQKIAADCVTAIDDGTIANEWGSQNIDDEGNPQQKRILIENGVLKSYMVDMRNGRRMNMEATGSSRRQSYRFSPTSRMSNTYIANGEYKYEEIIANTKYGLFAKKMGGGSVNPATGEFNFSVSEGYLIEDGKITKPVRGATLIGNGKDTLFKIDMVADNCTFGYGMCGSASGSIPACVGQPTIRVKEMTVGGNGGRK